MLDVKNLKTNTADIQSDGSKKLMKNKTNVFLN